MMLLLMLHILFVCPLANDSDDSDDSDDDDDSSSDGGGGEAVERNFRAR